MTQSLKDLTVYLIVAGVICAALRLLTQRNLATIYTAMAPAGVGTGALSPLQAAYSRTRLGPAPPAVYSASARQSHRGPRCPRRRDAAGDYNAVFLANVVLIAVTAPIILFLRGRPAPSPATLAVGA